MLVRTHGTNAPAIGDVGALAARLVACGFDADWYLHKYPDLRQAGLNAAAAVFHFIMDGAAEGREAVCGPLGAGLPGLAEFAFPDRRYAARMFRGVFMGQMRNAVTGHVIWSVADAGLIATIRARGAIPFAMFGDSHACLYVRSAWVGERWLAPLVFARAAASATGLVNERSMTAAGPMILAWARDQVQHGGGVDLPIFLKFGGMDAEYLWMMRRVRDGVRVFSAEEYDEFARSSVARYGRFIEAMCAIVDRKLLRVCTPFPTVLGDAHWAECVVAMQDGADADRQAFAAALAKIETPSLRIRSLLRRVYIRHLRAMCAASELRFVDDFSPLLGPDGIVQPRYVGGHAGKDLHMDYDAPHAPILAVILAALDLPPPA